MGWTEIPGAASVRFGLIRVTCQTSESGFGVSAQWRFLAELASRFITESSVRDISYGHRVVEIVRQGLGRTDSSTSSHLLLRRGHDSHDSTNTGSVRYLEVLEMV
jgi:hypothetical protein